MKLMTFSEINDLENGQQIPALQGTLKKVYEQKTGIGDYGPWHLQNIILEDEHANELTVTWSSEDAWSGNDIGKHLLFESGRDKKDQLAGIKREIRNKNGKRYESVKVDDRAKVITGATEQRDTAPNPNWPDVEKPKQIRSYAEALKEPVHIPPKKTNGDGITDARKHIMQAANLMLLAMEGARWTLSQYQERHKLSEPLPDAHFQALCATYFIDAQKSGYVQKMPTYPTMKELQ